MKVERLHLRGFAEGVEIPIVGISVTMQRDSAATATIQIVPTPLAHFILPRTIMHVFYSDDVHPDYITTALGSGQISRPNTSYQTPPAVEGERVVPDVPAPYTRYRLLFVGEVVSLQYVKNRGNRSVVLMCQDLSNYWDSVLHDIKGGLFAPRRMPRFEGRATGAFHDLLGGETGAIYDKLSTPPSSFPHVQGFLAGIMHLMEEVFGTYHRRVSGGEVITSSNPFAAMAELRLRLLQQVGVPPGDSTPLRLMHSQGFGTLWRRSIRGLPRQFNFRMLMQALMQYTFYSVYPLTTPSYKAPTGEYARTMGWSKLTAEQEEEANSEASRNTIFDRILSGVNAFKSMLDEAKEKISRDGLTIETEALLQRIYAWCRDQAPQLIRTARRVMTGPNNVVAYLGILESYHARYYPGQIDDFAGSADMVLAGLPPGSGSAAALRRRIASGETGDPAFLYTQLFRPDIWFCPPPRCNVLFPEHIVTMSMGRNFLGEPTRLLIRGFSQLMGSDAIFDNWYFAPMTAGLLRDRPVLRRSGGSLASGDARVSSDLMPHEIYTGILPFFQKMSDREMTIGKNVIGAGSTRETRLVGGRMQTVTTSVEDQSLDYFQRVTNFLFFKTRFSARTMSLDCKFNPYVVPGFPGLVLDAPTSHIETRNNDAILQVAENVFNDMQSEATGEPLPQRGEVLDLLKGRTGVHFLGMIEAVTHTLNVAGQGSTLVTMGYARDHREDIEYFGTDVVEMRRRRRVYREVQRRMTDVERTGILGAVEGALAVAEAGRRVRYGCFADAIAHVNDVPSDADADSVPDPSAFDVSRGMARAMDPIIESSMSAAARLLALNKTGTLPGREQVTSKTWRVACYSDNPPVVGGAGPWGGPITGVRDVTAQYGGTLPTTHAQQRTNAHLETELQQLGARRLETMDNLNRSYRREETDSLIEYYSTELRSIDARATAIRSRIAGNAGRTTTSARLSLFGVCSDGSRLPAASIPAGLVGTPNPARLFGPDVVSYIGDGNLSVIFLAYEIVEDITAGADKVNFPVEDIVRPPWYPAVWFNGRIGGGAYLPLLGVGAISDPMAVVSPGHLPDATAMTPGDEGVASTLSPDAGDEASLEVMGSIMHGATVEGAVDFLVHTYSKMRDQGYDTAEFAKDYTWRPIATLFDLFGSRDLEIKGDGTITRGVEGFHSRAFGPYADFFGLAPQDTCKLLGVDADDVAARARLDVRGRRHAVILAYQRELTECRIHRG